MPRKDGTMNVTMKSDARDLLIRYKNEINSTLRRKASLSEAIRRMYHDANKWREQQQAERREAKREEREKGETS